MKSIPSGALRNNVGTWAVSSEQLPMTACAMLAALPRERFDPDFHGQHLETTYFDTTDFDLRRARLKGDKYLTLRIRCYRTASTDREEYALSAKTESAKVRMAIDPNTAEFLLAGVEIANTLAQLLPADLQARLLALTSNKSVGPVVCVYARRYAVETETDRLTLDVAIHTDMGKCLPFNVLEFKRAREEATPPGSLASLGLRPIKSSKFLWATNTES
jgi:hypothetical protein